MEKWKDIKGYEGIYQVSDKGNVKSLERIVTEKNGKTKKLKERTLKPVINNNGYCELILHKNKKYKHYRVHRLVAEAFIENPNNYPIINHKDGNRRNNIKENIEWCTYKYNYNYDKKEKPCWYKGKRIDQYDENMEYIKTYNSLYEIEKEYNVSRTAIRFCCLGKNKTCRGYIWRYADEDKQEQSNWYTNVSKTKGMG